MWSPRRYPGSSAAHRLRLLPFPPRGKFGHVTAGDSLFEAASHALDWFSDPHWHGPKPAPSTVLEITLVGDERRWLVPARRVMDWRAQDTPAP
jgi:hypothetical protein